MMKTLNSTGMGSLHQPASRMLKKTLLAGGSKTLRYKAPEIPRSETYMKVRRNDEG
jgi:hypothetical protein